MSEEVAQRLKRYGLKAQQHLSRVRLSHSLALKSFASNADFDDVEADLLRQSFDDEGSGDVHTKLLAELHEIHLVALKANFELYLNRIATVAAEWQVTGSHRRRSHGIVALLLNSGLKKSLLAALLAEGQSDIEPEDVIDRVVPVHGLPALLKCLDLITGVSLRDVLNHRHDRAGWAQIAVAFEVRHLIEHRDGKVDGRFRNSKTVQENWPHSSWKRVSVSELDKVPVEHQDVVATYEAMMRATDVFTRSLLDWCVSSQA
jgi:hypothetical protein